MLLLSTIEAHEKWCNWRNKMATTKSILWQMVVSEVFASNFVSKTCGQVWHCPEGHLFLILESTWVLDHWSELSLVVSQGTNLINSQIAWRPQSSAMSERKAFRESFVQQTWSSVERFFLGELNSCFLRKTITSHESIVRLSGWWNANLGLFSVCSSKQWTWSLADFMELQKSSFLFQVMSVPLNVVQNKVQIQ